MKRMLGLAFVTIVGFAIGGCTSENPDVETDAFAYPAPPESDARPQPSPSDDAMPQRPPDRPPQNRPDGGIPSQLPCTEACGNDQVCAPFGKCVPDCRTAECPQPNMICDQNTGLCEADPTTDGGPKPPLSAKCTVAEDCKDGMICSPMSTCVPDCRNGLQCPTHMPTCDQDTGLCGK